MTVTAFQASRLHRCQKKFLNTEKKPRKLTPCLFIDRQGMYIFLIFKKRSLVFIFWQHSMRVKKNLTIRAITLSKIRSLTRFLSHDNILFQHFSDKPIKHLTWPELSWKSWLPEVLLFFILPFNVVFVQHGEVDEVRPVPVDDGAKSQAVPPRAAHVADIDPGVTLGGPLAPNLQGLRTLHHFVKKKSSSFSS